MKKDKLGAFIDAVYAITITICMINLKKPETMTWGALWSVRDSIVSYTITFFMMISMWIQIHYLWEQIGRIDTAVIWACVVFLFTSSFVPYTTSLMMEENFANRYFAVLYGGLTILISVNLLVIQKTAERCNKDYLKQYRKKNILPTQRIMFYDILIKIVGTLISVFLWAPAIIIAVFIAFEYNSLATRITQRRHMRAVAAESAALESAALASLGAMDTPKNEPDPEDD